MEAVGCPIQEYRFHIGCTLVHLSEAEGLHTRVKGPRYNRQCNRRTVLLTCEFSLSKVTYQWGANCLLFAIKHYLTNYGFVAAKTSGYYTRGNVCMPVNSAQFSSIHINSIIQ